MNLKKRFAVSAIAASSMVLALAACAPGGDGGDDAAKRLCYITAANSHFYVTPANEGAQDAADAAGFELTIVSEEFSAQTGAEQLQTCVSQGVDGILLWPLDENSYLPGLTAAKEAGIPVVAIDTKSGDASMALIASFVGADKYGQGEVSAQTMDEALGGSGGVIIIAGQAGNPTEIARTSGFNDKLASMNSGLTVLELVHADFDQQKALVASRDLLTKYGDQIKGVYAEDDAMAAGFLQALEESGLNIQPVVLGIGGTTAAFDAIKTGKMHSSIMQPPYLNGKLALETLIKVVNGQSVDAVVPLPNDPVNAGNVDTLQPTG